MKTPKKSHLTACGAGRFFVVPVTLAFGGRDHGN
jgi:hypothetical protein